MKASMLKQRVYLQQKQVSQGALGQTVTWIPVQELYARVIALDTRTIAQFQQLNTVATHKILMRGEVTVDLGDYRFVHKDKTYQPTQSAKHFEDITEVIVEEV